MKKLKVHYFQHIAGEGFGSCLDYLIKQNAEITATEFFALPVGTSIEIEALPKVEDVDLLLIMGGAMSVNDEVNYPWLKIEKRWIRRYLALEKPAIGLCLGGQLIANALGASVYRNDQQELGWTMVSKSIVNCNKYFEFPNCIKVMQWHSETFDLPKGAIRLAETNVCQNQLFQIGRNILGFQFHPEITRQALKVFIEHEEQANMFYEKGCFMTGEDVNTQDYQYGNQLLNRAIDYVLQK